MKLKPTTVEFLVAEDPNLYAVASRDGEFGTWSAQIVLSCSTGAKSPEVAVSDLALLAARFAKAVEDAEKEPKL